MEMFFKLIFAFLVVVASGLDTCYPSTDDDAKTLMVKDPPGKVCCALNALKSICSYKGQDDDSVTLDNEAVGSASEIRHFELSAERNNTVPATTKKIYPVEGSSLGAEEVERNMREAREAHEARFARRRFTAQQVLGPKFTVQLSGSRPEKFVFFPPPPGFVEASADYTYSRQENSYAVGKFVRTQMRIKRSQAVNDFCDVHQVVANAGDPIPFNLSKDCYQLCSGKTSCAQVLICGAPFSDDEKERAWKFGILSMTGARILDLQLVFFGETSKVNVLSYGDSDCVGDGTANFKMITGTLEVFWNPQRALTLMMALRNTIWQTTANGPHGSGDYFFGEDR